MKKKIKFSYHWAAAGPVPHPSLCRGFPWLLLVGIGYLFVAGPEQTGRIPPSTFPAVKMRRVVDCLALGFSKNWGWWVAVAWRRAHDGTRALELRRACSSCWCQRSSQGDGFEVATSCKRYTYVWRCHTCQRDTLNIRPRKTTCHGWLNDLGRPDRLPCSFHQRFPLRLRL